MESLNSSRSNIKEAITTKSLELLKYIQLKENCSFYEAIKIVEALHDKDLLDIYLENIGYLEVV